MRTVRKQCLYWAVLIFSRDQLERCFAPTWTTTTGGARTAPLAWTPPRVDT